MTNIVRAQPETDLTYRRGVILVLLAGMAWSTMGLGIRSLEVANVWQILFYRSLALAPFLFLIMAVRAGGNPLPVIRKAGLAAVVGGMCLVLAFAGGIYAIQTTTVANAMFLFAASPFIAAILGRAILAESVRRSTWIAMGIASIGIIIMVANGFAIGAVEGNIAALLSALGFAIFTVSLRWGKLSDMLPAVFLSGIFAAVTGALVCALAGYGFALPAWDLAIVFTMGVGQLGLGLTLYTLGSKAVPAVELALLSLVEVALGPLWVWLVYGETVSTLTMVGGGVLLAALAGNALTGTKRKPIPTL